MKPKSVLFSLLIVLGILAGISAVFPKNGIPLFGGVKLKFVTISEFFENKKPKAADISKILKNSEAFSEISKKDSVASEDTAGIAVEPGKVVQKIEYPDGNKEVLSSFFHQLTLLKNSNELIRIVHFGDSQLEGDRITSYVRDKLQTRFGGGGAGLLALYNPLNPGYSMLRSESKTWKRFTVQGKTDPEARTNKYGILTSFARFTSLDSLKKDSVYQNWVTYKVNNQAFASSKNFSTCKLYYGNSSKPVVSALYYGERLVKRDTLRPTTGVTFHAFNVNPAQGEFTLKLKGQSSADFYGVTIDNDKGIAVDNIPMRGSSGTEFTKLDLQHFKQMSELMNVKMLILEYGVNVVPNIVDDYTFYENMLYSQLAAIKRIRPDISILVIGVSDMTRKNNGEFESFPNIEKIRDAQKRAAFKAGCAFWDMYLAMGGKNSMQSWVEHKPQLASEDFTHFNQQGARIIAEMFFNAFVQEYNDFISGKKLAMSSKKK